MKLHVANKRQNTLSVYDSVLAKYGLNRIPGAFNGKPGLISAEVPDKDVDICCKNLKKKAPYLVISKGEPPPLSATTGGAINIPPVSREMEQPPDDRPPGFGTPPVTIKTDTKSTKETEPVDTKKEDSKKKK